MLVLIKNETSIIELENFVSSVSQLGYNYNFLQDSGMRVVEIINDELYCPESLFSQDPCVEKIISSDEAYKKASRKKHPANTVIEVGSVKIGGGQVQIIAGPCSIESHEQAARIASKVAALGIKLFRGGAFKPRTSPYSFQGLSEEGLKILKSVTRETGMYAVTELLDVRHADMICEYADIVQIGTRNAMNYPLLKEAGRLNKPVLLKRGISSTIKEFLLCAEYIMSQGNEQVILCERGIKTFETAYRSTLDLAAVSIIKELSHLPIIVDPSHASGAWNLVSDLSLASIAAGADGVMIEVHDIPSEALSDSRQSLKPEKLSELVAKIAKIASCLGRSSPFAGKGPDKI